MTATTRTTPAARHLPDLPFSRRARELRDAPISWLMGQALQVPQLLSLAAGFVDQATLPNEELARLVKDLLCDPKRGPAALQYGTNAGDERLRRSLLGRLTSEAAVWNDVTADDVVVTAGSQELLYLLAEVFVEAGDVVLVENPSYFVYVGALRSFGCEIVGVQSDHHGMSPSALDTTLAEIAERGLLERTKLLYLMTYSQNPNGATLSAERRPRIWEVFEAWVEKGLNAVVLEDAAYRHLRFPGVEDIAPLFEQQRENQRVCYTESFSKVLSPGVRLGFGVVPAKVREALLRLKSHHDFGTSNFCQQLVLRVLEDGLYDRHLEVIRGRYRDKCRLLFDLLATELGDAVELVEPVGGLFLWMTLRDDIDTGLDGRLFQRSLEEKVLYVPGEICAVSSGDPTACGRRSMRLCYAYPTDEDLAEAGRRLVRAVRSLS